jgi:aminomethyltransferase
MGYPLYGQDITEETSPLEADLGRFMDLRRDFIGSRALRAAAESCPTRQLVAFEAETRRRAETGQEIIAGKEKVGAVTSSGFSPFLGVSIGLGYVAHEFSEPGTELQVRHPRMELPIRVTEKPLYTEGTCRRKNLSEEDRL